MQHARKITTIGGLVKAFGGAKKLAEWAGIGVSGVSNWVERDFIPPGWHYRLHLEAIDRGFEIDPVVFGVERPLTRFRKDEKETRRFVA